MLNVLLKGRNMVLIDTVGHIWDQPCDPGVTEMSISALDHPISTDC